MKGSGALLALSLASLCRTIAARASSLRPPVLPLIVRNPYLSTWLPDARDEPWLNWPMFYTGRDVGFGVLVSVPETRIVYPLLGRPHDSLDWSDDRYNVSFATYLGSSYDASVTNLTYAIPSPEDGGTSAIVKLSFLSPITPTSTLRQSIPAAYLTVHAEGDFDVSVYIDLNGDWVSGYRGNRIDWSLEHTSIGHGKRVNSWTWKRETEQLFTEIDDRAEWGTLIFTGPSDVAHQSGTSFLLRTAFATNSTLQDQTDTDYREIMDEEPVFAFSKSFNLSSHSSDAGPKSDSVLFTIAHVRDPVAHFASARGLTQMKPLWTSWFPEVGQLTKFHYLDYHNASALAQNYSDQLAIDAYKSGSDSYVDIVALSARQALGGTDFVGTEENPLLFLKEISSDGNAQTIDVIFPAFPFFLYTQPRWLAYLLEPLIEHMLSGQYPNKYAMHDLGSSYPNLTGHADGKDEYMPVEECGNILIMGLALANSLEYGKGSAAQSPWAALSSVSDPALASSDSAEPLRPSSSIAYETRDGISGLDPSWASASASTSSHPARRWLSKSYPLWKQWTSYLVEYALEPENQLSTDDFAGWLALQTNLALKGIVGIRAMSKLAEFAGEDDDAHHYANISEVYVKKWEGFAMSRDGTHAKLAYDWYGSWTTLYSLYADALLCFHPLPSPSSSSSSSSSLSSASGGRQAQQAPMQVHVDSSRSNRSSGNFIPHEIYEKQSRWYSTVMQKYGLPLDSRHLYAKSDWEFEAAAVASPSTRAAILERVARWLNETVTDLPFTDLYTTEGDGGFPDPFFYARPVVGGHFAFLALERACGGDGVAGLQDWDH